MQPRATSHSGAPAGLCPNCRFPIESGDTFCGECGFDLTRQPPPSIPVAGEPGESDVASQALKARLVGLRAPRGLRRSYFDLGLALKEAGRFGEAAAAFANALQTAGSLPKDADIYLQQAHAFEQQFLPEKAFRPYLEVVRKEPGAAGAVLPHLHGLLDEKIVLENGVWLTAEWARSFEALPIVARDRATIELFLGRCLLFLGQYEAALAAFERANQLDPQTTQESLPALLAAEKLPAEFDPRTRHGQAQFALAQAWRLLGHRDEALRAAEVALSMDLGQGDYPEAPVQRLKAELLEAGGQNSAAAQWYYEAGRRYSWREDQAVAAELLQHAVQLQEDFAPACWAWMEAERARAYLDEPPYVDGDALQRSLAAWQAGLRSGWPTAEYFWVYTTRALLCELEARLDSTRRIEHWWHAVRWLELALVHDARDAFSWAYLGRFFRYLNLEANALAVTEQAVELDASNVSALEERAAALANRGEWQAALEMIDQRRLVDSTAWAEGLTAYILFHQAKAAAAQALAAGLALPLEPPWIRQVEQALRLLDRLMSVHPPDAWYFEMRAACLRALPRHAAEAHSAYEDLYQWYQNPLLGQSDSGRFTFGWAAFCTGRVEEAIEIFSSLRADPLLSGAAWRNLGICRLAQGDELEGEADLLEGLALAQNPRECDDLVNDLHEIEPLPGDLFLRLCAKITARRAQVVTAPAPEDEIKQVLHSARARSAAMAVLARQLLAGLAYEDVLALYHALDGEEFPLKAQAIDHTLAAWQDNVDRFLKEGYFNAAREQLAVIEKTLPVLGLPQRLGEVFARLALADFSQDWRDEGAQRLEQALRSGQEAGWVAPGEQIADLWRGLLIDARHYWQLDAHLAAWTPGLPLSEDVAALRQGLQPFVSSYFQLDHDQAAADFFSEPIVLWVGTNLIPLVDPAVHPAFIKEKVPALRRRIQEARGIAIPAVRVRDDSHLSDGYRLMVAQREAGAGEVYAGRSFCAATAEDLQALQVDAAVCPTGSDPISGAGGFWVEENDRQRLRQAGCTLLAADDYLLAQVEKALGLRLADLTGVSVVQSLLDHLDPREHVLIERSLPNPEARLVFARLVRALVREGVPVKRLPDLLQAAGDHAAATPAHFDDLLRAARLLLRDLLPGNQGERRIPIPPAWEERLLGWVAGKPPTAGDLDELAQAARQWAGATDRVPALVVQSAALRPHLQRWIAARLPAWAVLASEEVTAEAGGIERVA